MAAPTWVQSSAGTVATATGAFNTGSLASVTIGNLIIIQVLVDGTSSTVTVTDTNSTIEDVAGTDNTMTVLDGPGSADLYPVGSPQTAAQWLFVGRALATSVNADLNNDSTDDVYLVIHEFATVNAGATVADILENSTAGNTVNGTGTSTTVSDTAVTTLGPDRLALNLVAINDDATGIAAFVGATGGTWSMPKSFESSTGTDGTVALMTAAMASAGTIDGGSDTITSDAWGVAGFALIGTTPSVGVPRHPGINHQDPGLLAKAWERGRSGVWLPPKLWTPRRPALVV